MIKNVIFDMGRVIIDFDSHQIFDPYLPQPPKEEDRKLLEDACFRSGLWPKLDSGEVQWEEDLIKPICEKLPERLHPAATGMLRHWHEHLVTRDDTFHLMKELKENGYRLYLLSNAGYCFGKYEHSIPAFRFLDGKIVSAFYGKVKPQPEIYQTLFDTFQLNPAECFFIDDLKANIEAGQALGMDGVVYDNDMPKLRRTLKEKGIRVSTDPLFVPVKTPEQVQALSALSAEIQRDYFPAITGSAQVEYMLEKFQSPAAIEKQLEEGYLYYFMEEDGKYVGFFGAHPEEYKLFLSKLYLKKECRGKGYARQAMNFLRSIAEQRGLSSIYLTCNKGNAPSLAAYHKMGFVTVQKVVTDIGGGFVMDDDVLELSV